MIISPDKKTAGEILDELLTASLKAQDRPTSFNQTRRNLLERLWADLCMENDVSLDDLKEDFAALTKEQWQAQEIMNRYTEHSLEDIYASVVRSQELNIQRKVFIDRVNHCFDHTRGLSVPKTYESDT